MRWNACADTHYKRDMSKEYSKECNKVKRRCSSKLRETS